MYLIIGMIWTAYSVLLGQSDPLTSTKIYEERKESFDYLINKYGMNKLLVFSAILNVTLWPIYMPYNLYTYYKARKNK